MKLYQLRVSGRTNCDFKHNLYSRRVFRTATKAENYLPQFIAECTAPLGKYDLWYLEVVKSTNILELELED